VATAMTTPAIAVQSNPDRFTLEAALELEELTDLPRNASLRLGLSAVIEETSGHKSYWALAHPPGKRNTSIHQLSGGEKALTAISLVFAQGQVRSVAIERSGSRLLVRRI